MKAAFAGYEKKEAQILDFLHRYDIRDLEHALAICTAAGIDAFATARRIQPICFDDACWAYTVSAAAAIQAADTDVRAIARTIGEGLQSFCQKNSVAEKRRLGIGHGELAAMCLDEEKECFAFLAGHESFAAAEGAIGISQAANQVRSKPLRVVLVGLGKDAAEIISRINGFTYVETRFHFAEERLEVVREETFSKGERGRIKCYGADEVREGVAIMERENVDISISGNATNMIRFQHPVAGAYKKRCLERGKAYFACASGGGIGRTLNPDDTSAGPSSYGLTDTVSLMYADAIFAGSSSVPAHVEMMGYIGMGNNPMVGTTVTPAVAVGKYLNQR